MSIRSVVILTLFLSFFTHKIFSLDMVEASFLINDKSGYAVENATIKIGDLTLKTSKDGVAKIILFPAVYDLTIEKSNFFTISSQVDISSTKNQFQFEMETKLVPISLKTLDSTSNQPISTNISIENKTSNQNSLFSSDSSGSAIIALEKGNNYKISINDKMYKPNSIDLDSSKLSSSDISIKLDRNEYPVKFKTNINSGLYSIKGVTSGKIFSGSFSNNLILLNLPFDTYSIIISGDNYKTFEKSFDLISPLEDNLNLEANFNSFKISLSSSDKQSIQFLSEVPQNIQNIKNPLIVFYKNKVPIYTFKNLNSVYNINYGTYDISVSGDFIENSNFESIKIDSDSVQNIVLTSKESYSTINGVVKTSDLLIGGVQVIFSDENNNTYTAVSNIDGNYSIKLPPRSYTVSILKEGYKLNSSFQTKTDRYLPSGSYLLNIPLDEILSIITGKITTLSGAPIPKAKIIVKVDKLEQSYYSEDDGSYKISLNAGLVFIKIEKPGLKSKGTVKMINKFSTLSGLDFKLEEILSSIEGNIRDSSFPLNNVQIQLLDENKKLVTSVISRQDGSFKFESLPSYKKYSIVVENINYFKYCSKDIDLSASPIANYGIILTKNSVPFILEVRSSNNLPAQNIDVYINGNSYKTDINGFAEALIKIDNDVNIIEISIPQVSYKEIVELKKNQNTTYKKSVIINLAQ